MLAHLLPSIMGKYQSNSFVKKFANACFVVSDVSNSPIIIIFGFQSFSKKLITRAKTSWAA
jgi:hypothetical protein